MFEIKYRKSVEKDLRLLPSPIRKALISKIILLAEEPLPVGAVKLQGATNLYRIRKGDYRILYEINNQEVVVIIIKVGHRRDVYR